MRNGIPDTAVVLAGGLGTRLSSVVSDLPKPMAPVQGRPFLEHLLDYWRKQGIYRFVLSVGYKAECIINHFQEEYERCSLEYVVENKPLGTGGALLHCLHSARLENPFFLLNGDTYFAVQLEQLYKKSTEQDSDWCLSLFPTSNFDRYLPFHLKEEGRLELIHNQAQQRFSNDQIKKEGKGKIAKVPLYGNGGVYLVNPRALELMFFKPKSALSLEKEILPTCFKSGQRIYGIPCNETFIDIGIPSDYARSQTMTCFHLNYN